MKNYFFICVIFTKESNCRRLHKKVTQEKEKEEEEKYESNDESFYR